MNEPSMWTLAVGGAAALIMAGCVADTNDPDPAATGAPLQHELLNPTAPLGPDDPQRFVPFDAGRRDAARGDIPGRDDDRTAVDDVPYGPFNEHLPMTCGGTTNDVCPEGMVCCPASHECVPESCPGCCDPDAIHRYTPISAPNPEQLPDVNPVGPPPGDPGDPDGPGEDPDPGPMPPPPGAP